MKDLWERRQLLIEHSKSLHPNLSSNAIDTSEESDLRTFHESKIIDVCSHLKFDLQVLIASIMIHKRFYLHQSMMQCKDPKHIMLACIFLGSKVGNLHLEANFITAKVAGSDPLTVLELEFHILSHIQFELTFPALDAAFHGVLLYFGEFLDMHRVREMIFPREIHRILLSDLLLVYPAKDVALAVTCNCVKEVFDAGDAESAAAEMWKLVYEKALIYAPDLRRELVDEIIQHLESSSKVQPQQKLKEISEKLKVYCAEVAKIAQ